MAPESGKILIVDDSDQIVESLSATLAENGYCVICAYDGDEAIGAAKRERPDLILMDIVMPRMSGLTACRVLRADPSLDKTPIVLLTAEDDPESIVNGLSAGANDYVLKSVHKSELLARIGRHLSVQATFRAQLSRERLIAIGQIALSIQHEINNPLTSVLGFLDMALRHEALPERVRKYLLTARAEGRRIREIVARLDNVEDRPVDPFGVGEMIDLSPPPEGAANE